MSLVEVDTVIDAPVEAVWAAMLDLDNYPRWNPFIVRVDRPNGRPARVGDTVTLHVRFKNGQANTSRERISRIESPTLLEYGYVGWLHRVGLLHGTRIQRLEPADGGGTRYHTEELLRGPLKSVVFKGVRDGFRRHAAALKEYVERR
jgi:uncharacterized protein YndB with AHSA1/START domain